MWGCLARNDSINSFFVVTALMIQYSGRSPYTRGSFLVRINAHEPRCKDKRQSSPRVPFFAKIKLLRP
jgi:hypothetical protein